MKLTTIAKAALLSLACLAASPVRAADDGKGEFLFGGDFPMNPSEKVRQLFYESGMNCIRLTGGGYSWASAGHKKLADDFQSRGLKVYLQLGSHYPSADYFKLESSKLVDQDGKSGVEDRKAWSISYSGHHWPQYSYASDEFRKQLERDFAAYLKGFAGNTNVAGVILHNEPGYFWQGDRLFDYGAKSVAAYRAWLEKQHGTIQNLNGRWGTNHASFADITPPGKPPHAGAVLAAWMDWRRFSAAQIGDFMSWESGFFKQQRPDIPRSTNLAGPLDHWFGIRGADNYLCSLPMDNVGIDIYPTQWSHRTLVPYTMDMSHGIAQGRGVHVHECDTFSPKLWKDYSEPQRADMFRGEIWSFIGHGAKAVLVWGFSRGDNFSLTNGEPNDRYYAGRDIAHYGKMIGVGSYSRPRPQVAVVVDPDSYIHATGIEPKPNNGSPGEDSDAHGMYAAVADSHIPSDVIFAAQLTDGSLKNYRAIVLAGARMMDEKTAAALEQFVLAGGTLIADAPLATMDRWAKPYASVPGAGLEKVFGQITDASPAVTNKTYGKGKAIMINSRAGQSYLGSSNRELAAIMKDSLSQCLVDPAVRQADPGLNTSIVADDAGNMLLVASTLGGKGKLAPVIPDGKITISLADANAVQGVFLLAPSQFSETASTSGPRKLEITRTGNTITLDAGEIASAAPIFVAKDAGPMLAIAAQGKPTAGQEIAITLTIHNPSPRPLAGKVALRVNGADSPESSAVNVVPGGQQSVIIKAAPVAGRNVINAVLQHEKGQTLGVPVDVTAQ